MMLLQKTFLFARRCWRLILIVGTILGETLYLNLSVRQKPASQRLRYRADRQSSACRRVVRIWNVEVRLLGEAQPDGSCVIVSNHLGILDGFVVASVFPVSISGKAELLKVPVVGWVCRSIAMIPVYRQRRLLSADFADNVAGRLDAGVNVLVFPEGTTVAGTEIMPFKTGGFAAIEHTIDRIALPITLMTTEVDGESPDSRTHSWFTWSDPQQSLFSHFWNLLGVRSARLDIVVGRAVPAAGLTRKQLADRCFAEISAVSKSQVFTADTRE
jgi:1-acyl-sn-glycerol-3-phosphate acyltransferase